MSSYAPSCGASHIPHALKLPRVSVVRRLEELIKHGYGERVGNAYHVTNKVNIPELQNKLQRRIDMVAETAKRLAEVGGSGSMGPQ
jgi:DNA-binding IclR family transcriptional regulator